MHSFIFIFMSLVSATYLANTIQTNIHLCERYAHIFYFFILFELFDISSRLEIMARQTAEGQP